MVHIEIEKRIKNGLFMSQIKNLQNPAVCSDSSSHSSKLVESAMILAAGRGERMKPLTDYLPKPLLPIAGKPMMQRHLEQLMDSGFSQVVINHAWLGHLIESHFQNRFDGISKSLDIIYSREQPALETAGGIAKALKYMPLSDASPYLFVINGDVVCDWDFEWIEPLAWRLHERGDWACLVLVPNPPHHLEGDFAFIPDIKTPHVDEGNPSYFLDLGRVFSAESDPLDEREKANNSTKSTLTFAGIGIYHRDLFLPLCDESHLNMPCRLAPILREAMAQNRVMGHRFMGDWQDIGTPERYLSAGGNFSPTDNGLKPADAPEYKLFE